MRKLAHIHCFHKESCLNLPKVDRSSLYSSLWDLDRKWSLLVFNSFHDAFLKAALRLLLDFRNFAVIRSRCVSKDVQRCIQLPKYQQIHVSGCVVWICQEATVMGTGERNLQDTRRQSSEVSGLWYQGFLYQSVQGARDHISRLVDRWRFDGILRWL